MRRDYWWVVVVAFLRQHSRTFQSIINLHSKPPWLLTESQIGRNWKESFCYTERIILLWLVLTKRKQCGWLKKNSNWTMHVLTGSNPLDIIKILLPLPIFDSCCRMYSYFEQAFLTTGATHQMNKFRTQRIVAALPWSPI